jgi:uncharacterized protein (DUF58 family)
VIHRLPVLVPTPRQVVLWTLPIGVAIVYIGLPVVLVPLVLFDLLLVGVLLLDALLVAFSGDGGLVVRREVAPVQSVGTRFDVVLRIVNRGRRTRVARVIDTPPGPVFVGPSGVTLPATVALPGDSEVEVAYRTVVDRRGAFAFGGVALRWRSPLGLWERQRRLPIETPIRVYPDFAQLRTWGADARLQEERVPVRSRRRVGGENEFQRLRPYVAGDPYRHIDWRATARKREFVTREFGQESNQNVIFLVDAGRMMSAEYAQEGSAGLTAFDHALNAALMMGQVALKHGDRVGMLVFDDRVRAWLPPKGGRRSSSRLIRSTYDIEPSLAEPDYALAFRHLATRVRRRSLVVLFTAVVDEVNAKLAHDLVRGLGRRHVALSVWVRDPALDAMLERPASDSLDRWRRGAAAEIAVWRERRLAALRRRGAHVVDAPVSDLTPSLLARYLEIKARRLL